MAKIERPDGLILYDEIEDLRGNAMHKNVEKAQGPLARWKDGTLVAFCPLCRCNKSFDPNVPNEVTAASCEEIGGECPCHE